MTNFFRFRRVKPNILRTTNRICVLSLIPCLMFSSFGISPVQAKNKYGMPTAQELRDKVAACRKKYGNDSPETADALEALARCWELIHTHENDEEILRLLTEAAPIRKKSYDPQKFSVAFGQAGSVAMVVPGAEYAIDLWNIGKILLLRRVAKRNGALSATKSAGGKTTLNIGVTDLNAVEVWKQLTTMSEKSLGAEAPTTTNFMLDLGRAYENEENYLEAEAVAKKIIAIEENRHKPKDKYSTHFSALGQLFEAYIDSGNDKLAEPVVKQEIAYLSACDPEGPFMAGTLEKYGELLRRQGRAGEAAKLEAHANQIRIATGAQREHSGSAVLLKK